MKLYERLGFLRSKKLHRYYLSGNSAYRLILYLKPPKTRGGVGRGGDCECGHDHGEGGREGEEEGDGGECEVGPHHGHDVHGRGYPRGSEAGEFDDELYI